MSFDSWKTTEPYDPTTESDPREDDRFACACGDPTCYGVIDDPQNVRVGSRWYAADCTHKPDAIVAEQEAASHADVARDDFNEERR